MEQIGQYFSFKGTATRKEYWAMIGITMVSYLMILTMLVASATAPALLLVVIFGGIASLMYNLATTVRRIRDSGNNVLWIIAIFLPYIAPVVVVIFGCLPTEE